MKLSELFIAVVLCVSTGCGGPDLTPVSGTVTINGKVPGVTGQITFHPREGKRSAIGHIQPDGTYRLTTFQDGDGTFAGDHRVSISVSTVDKPKSDQMPKDLSEEGKAFIATHGKLVWIVPEQFASEDTSGLTARVERGRQNTIDFSLP